MKQEELKEIRNRIVEAMKISARKMLLNKKRLGQKIVISENGIIKVIDPEDYDYQGINDGEQE